MSITNDIRSYAYTALEQGKSVVGQAQAQLTDVTGQANEFVGKLTGTAKDNVSGFTCKAPPGVQQILVASEPDRFYVPSHVGHRGWIGVNFVDCYQRMILNPNKAVLLFSRASLLLSYPPD